MTYDLTARLLDLEADQWELVKMPALNLKGEALWPSKFPALDLLKIRKSLGESLFTGNLPARTHRYHRTTFW